MPTRLTRADVERIAGLAHLDLTEDETEVFTRQLAQILEHAERLQDVDTTKDIWQSATTSSPLRPDVLHPSLSREDALANAPDGTSHGLFRVPKVIG